MGPVLIAAAAAANAFAQQTEIQQPPDFSQADIRTAAEETVSAWKAYKTADKNLEQDVFKMPMGEARERVQRAYGALLVFVERRRSYGESVAAYMDRTRAGAADRRRGVTVEPVDRDEIDVLGVSLSALQSKLDGLRSNPAWAGIGRGVRGDISDLTAFQAARREELPLDLPRSSPLAPNLLSAIVYRESERVMREGLQKLWTHYYQSLIDAIEQNPSGSKPLQVGTPGEVSANRAEPSQNPLAGVWTYVEGSQKFNGVAEPREVILELWMEAGSLVGRYRATLPDFDGERKIDLKLRALPGGGRDWPFEFKSTNPEASGRMALEGPDPNGLELMVVRAGSGIPRGRESLSRH